MPQNSLEDKRPVGLNGHLARACPKGPWGRGPMNFAILMPLQVLMLVTNFGWNWSGGS